MENKYAVTFSLNPKGAASALSVAFVLLLLVHGFVILMHYRFGHEHMFGLSPLFNMGNEHAIPTLFATLLLLVNAILFFVLFRVGDSSSYLRRVWLILSLVFCFLAVDEYAVVHERLIRPVRTGLNVDGYLYFAWIIPYAVGVVVLAFLAVPAIWRLGWRYRVLFGTSGVVYLSGAIGVEMLGGNFYQANQEQVNLNYRLLQTVEECLEYIGLIILTFTSLDLIRTRIDHLVLRLS